VRLRDLGEFGLIERIARAARRAGSGPAVRIGIGDDAALLRLGAREDLVVSTDARVEGVHFRFDWQSPRDAGHWALASALSDLAAMGARPLGALLALATPPSLDVAVFDALLRGALSLGARCGCPLVGGNVARAPVLSLTFTVLGAVARGRALRRDTARAGDRLFVTGRLGETALALRRAEAGGRIRHRPVPRLAAGRALVGLPGVGACIDISDGLLADLGHLEEASRVAFELDRARLPRAPGFEARCARVGARPDHLLAAGGEDYELLFTLRRRGPGEGALSRRLGVRVTEIGRAVPRQPGAGASRARGFRHF
jgi:thiamine-monophosphate kinase